MSKKLFFTFALLVSIHSTESYASQNKNLQVAPVPIAAVITHTIGSYLTAMGITRYQLGKKLANPQSTLTPESIKKGGLLRIAIGIGAMLPLAVLIGRMQYKTHKEIEFGKQLAAETNKLLLDREQIKEDKKD